MPSLSLPPHTNTRTHNRVQTALPLLEQRPLMPAVLRRRRARGGRRRSRTWPARASRCRRACRPSRAPPATWWPRLRRAPTPRPRVSRCGFLVPSPRVLRGRPLLSRPAPLLAAFSFRAAFCVEGPRKPLFAWMAPAFPARAGQRRKKLPPPAPTLLTSAPTRGPALPFGFAPLPVCSTLRSKKRRKSPSAWSDSCTRPPLTVCSMRIG